MAATCGFFQNDMKKVIAYSTCSQLGYENKKINFIYMSIGSIILNNDTIKSYKLCSYSTLGQNKDILPDKYYKLFIDLTKKINT
jgi:Proton-conducting membrane transporter